MDRVILHCDCNNFFASVEMVYQPFLRNVPMAVCGDPDSRHGIILAKNELAKAAGVQTAETIWKAQKKCPALQLVPPRYQAYSAYSRQINEIYARYTDMVEPFGIDESWLDVTGSQRLFGSGQTIADRLRHEVKAETGLTISVGISFNKVFAKLGSDYKKPDASTEISRNAVQQIIYPLPVETLLYVGDAVQRQLAKMDIYTIGQLAAADPLLLQASLGKTGVLLSRYARGEDNEPVRHIGDEREAKSVGNGMTFRHDLATPEQLRTATRILSESVATRLRKNGKFCQTVQITVKTPDLRTYTRQHLLPTATQLSREIANAAIALLECTQRPGTPVRMLTITATNLSDTQGSQTSLFAAEETPRHQRLHQLETAVDSIRDRYGKTVIGIGSSFNNDFLAGHTKPQDQKDKT